MPEQDAQEEDVRAEKQTRVEQSLREREGLPRTALAGSPIPTTTPKPWECTYASLIPRYVFVNARVNLTRILCGPPSGSLASTTRMSPKRSRRTDVGRAPAGASRRRKSTA